MIIGQVNPHHRFDNFMVETHNQFPHAALLAVAEAPGRTYNPLYIYGDAGDERAHLLNAIGNAIDEKDLRANLIVIPSEVFLEELINAFQDDDMIVFRAKYQEAELLIVNDLQLMSTKAGAMEELFSITNARYKEQKQTILASDCSPKRFSDFEARFQSTFEWGLIADIEPPGLEALRRIIERVAAEKGISISSEVVGFVSSEIEPYLQNRSITKFIEDILMHLVGHTSQVLSQLTFDLAKEALPHILAAISLRSEKGSIQVVDVSPVVLQMLNKDFSSIYKLDSEQFELLICERLSRMGFAVERVGSTYAPDGGVDIVAWPNKPDPFPFLLAVQVKHHRRPTLKTGPGAVKDLQAVIHSQAFQAGVLVTNTSFTPNAKWFASNSHHIIRLRDIDDLKRWLKGDFSDISNWREIPSEIELSPGVVVRIPNHGWSGHLIGQTRKR
jgi:hypothetical protein